MIVCVCLHVHTCVHVGMRVCLCVSMFVFVCLRVHLCVHVLYFMGQVSVFHVFYGFQENI